MCLRCLLSRGCISVDSHVKWVSRDLFVDFKNIIRNRLKVTGCVVRLGDEAVVLVSLADGFKQVGNGVETLRDPTDHFDALGYLGQRIAGFHSGADGSGRHTTCRDLLLVAHHAHVNVVLAADLVARNDDLGGRGVAGVGDRVLQQANAAHHLARGAELFRGEIGRVPDDGQVGGRRLAAGSYTKCLATLIVQDLVDVLVEHEGAPVDGTQAREALRETPQTVHGVQVWRRSVTVKGVGVQYKAPESVNARQSFVIVVRPKSHGVSKEILRVVVQHVVREHLGHCHLVAVVALPRLDVVLLPFLQEDEEIPQAALLEEANKRGLDGITGSSRNLFGLGTYPRKAKKKRK